MVFIYVLSLKNDKYYVGKTENPKFRLDTHFKNGGCYWTKKYSPVQIIGLFPDCDDFDEDKYTLKYMSKYGVDNVRGGSFCRCDLSIENKNTIDKMISSSNDCCHFCGEKGHFIGNCANAKEKNRYSNQNKHFLHLSKEYESADEVEIESDDESLSCSYCKKSFATYNGVQFHENVHCKVKKNQYCEGDEGDESDEDGEDISPENLEIAFREMDKDDGAYTLDGNTYLWYYDKLYEESDNYIGHRDGTFGNQYGDWRPIKKIKKKKKKQTKKSSSKCHRCGRNGHYKSSCYAKKHIKGFYLK